MPQNIKFNRRAASLLFASLLTLVGCATASPTRIAADRDTISREMALVLEYEKKRNELKKAIGFLAINGLFDSTTDTQVKESMSIEYIYYEASLVSLAHGDLADYRNFIMLAERELTRATTVLTARVQALQSERAS